VLDCCCTGALSRGDYLIIDNAAVHNGWDSMDVVADILQTAGVNLIFLPAYSPELNPCELVFNVVKSHIRIHRNFGSLILHEIVDALSSVSLDTMSLFYDHCIFPAVVLPELP